MFFIARLAGLLRFLPVTPYILQYMVLLRTLLTSCYLMIKFIQIKTQVKKVHRVQISQLHYWNMNHIMYDSL